MAGKVFKALVAIPVFIQADSDAEARTILEGRGLDGIAEEIDTGDMVGGSMEITSLNEVPRDELEAEMEAIGSDASFFDLGDEGEDEDGERDEA